MSDLFAHLCTMARNWPLMLLAYIAAVDAQSTATPSPSLTMAPVPAGGSASTYSGLAAPGFVYSVWGSSVSTNTGEGRPAFLTMMSAPRGLAWMPNGDLVATEYGQQVVSIRYAANGTAARLAGGGALGCTPALIDARSAALVNPYAIAAAPDGASV